MSGPPEGFVPTEDPDVFEYNPDGYIRSPEEQAMVDDALRNLREREAIPPDQRRYVADPSRFAAPIGVLTDEEERERARRREADTDG
jgi:hypothetical protein